MYEPRANQPPSSRQSSRSQHTEYSQVEEAGTLEPGRYDSAVLNLVKRADS